ncbi:MAG TPA: hypothetical protein VFZ78_00440 [Flavisolibacter sp.]
MEDNFSPQESLQLIRSMISNAKSNLSENRFYFLMWGWVVFAAILVQFVLKVFLHSEYHYMVWLAVIPAVFITVWYSRKQDRGAAVKTFVGESMGNLWIGVGISFFVLSFILSSMGREGWLNAYPFFILFYGLGTFVSGRILRFRPLVIGGIINWVLACAAVFFPYDYQLVFAAVAILTSYIIPGHLLRTKQ